MGAGRKKGVPNKTTIIRATRLRQLEIDGHDPITFFSDLLRNKSFPIEMRFAAAKELAPFMRPRLAAIEAVTGGKTHEQRLDEIRALLAEPDPELPVLELTAQRVPSEPQGGGSKDGGGEGG